MRKGEYIFGNYQRAEGTHKIFNGVNHLRQLYTETAHDHSTLQTDKNIKHAFLYVKKIVYVFHR